MTENNGNKAESVNTVVTAIEQETDKRARAAKRLFQLIDVDNVALRRESPRYQDGFVIKDISGLLSCRRRRRWMIKEPSMFTSRVIASKTSAAYIREETCRGPEMSEKLLASRAAKVFTGLNSDQLTIEPPPASIAKAIVSPKARPKPKMIDPKMPAPRVGIDDAHHRFPASRAQAVGRLPQLGRDAAQGVATDRRNSRQDHDRQHQGSRQQRRPVQRDGTVRVPAEDRQPGQPVGNDSHHGRIIGITTKIPHSP